MMKEDYLWDKTGEDAEIQGLENALKAFRYYETAPPALPAKVLTLENKTPRRFFHLRFAFAAFAAALAVLFVVWFQFAGEKMPAVETVEQINVPKTADKIDDEEIFTAPEAAAVESSPRRFNPAIAKTRRPLATKIRPTKAVWRNIKPKAPAEMLTAEEKYAYEQLMLALSITGSKLKLVKDKIDGMEE